MNTNTRGRRRVGVAVKFGAPPMRPMVSERKRRRERSNAYDEGRKLDRAIEMQYRQLFGAA